MPLQPHLSVIAHLVEECGVLIYQDEASFGQASNCIEHGPEKVKAPWLKVLLVAKAQESWEWYRLVKTQAGISDSSRDITPTPSLCSSSNCSVTTRAERFTWR